MVRERRNIDGEAIGDIETKEQGDDELKTRINRIQLKIDFDSLRLVNLNIWKQQVLMDCSR